MTSQILADKEEFELIGLPCGISFSKQQAPIYWPNLTQLKGSFQFGLHLK